MEHIRPTERTSIREWIKRYWIAAIMGLLLASLLAGAGVYAYQLAQLEGYANVTVKPAPQPDIYFKDNKSSVAVNIVQGGSAYATWVVCNRTDQEKAVEVSWAFAPAEPNTQIFKITGPPVVKVPARGEQQVSLFIHAAPQCPIRNYVFKLTLGYEETEEA